MTTFGELRCEVCAVSGRDVTMHRSGKKGPGEDPHWRCEGCLGKPVDPGILEITDAIEFRNMVAKGEWS